MSESLSTLINSSAMVEPGRVPVKYLYLAPEQPSEHMVVVFSGFHGRETERMPALFNYVRTLVDVDVHRLFIVDDYDGLPCYYIGHNGMHDYESAVASLIFRMLSEHAVAPKNVVMGGSSKGGSAALYFAARYGFGHALPGGAQYRVGSYLYGLSGWSRRELLAPIAGSPDEAGRDWLDNCFRRAIAGADESIDIRVHIGSGDPTRSQHIEPLIEDLAKIGVEPSVSIADYAEHSRLAEFYPPFLRQNVEEIVTVGAPSVRG